MLLGGLWHGASWTFVVWGALHGVALAVDKWRMERQGRRADDFGSPLSQVLGWAGTFLYVLRCLGVLPRARHSATPG